MRHEIIKTELKFNDLKNQKLLKQEWNMLETYGIPSLIKLLLFDDKEYEYFEWGSCQELSEDGSHFYDCSYYYCIKEAIVEDEQVFHSPLYFVHNETYYSLEKIYISNENLLILLAIDSETDEEVVFTYDYSQLS